ncbi:MAG: DeoR/GlpR family DNA-binding transcription regulator [Saccharofermentanales bacterium]|jgi:DeoR/GlpR family transcriptional regulator of sugar metabolism
MNERRMKILEDLSEKNSLSVKELSKMHKVSQVTIRNDLKYLEERGLLRRHHGGASSEKIAHRLDENYEAKLRIAERAAKMVEPGETIMIESGSTNALLARTLGETKPVSVITNSFFIANFVKDLPNIRTTVLGGDYQPESEACIGPLTKQSLQSFFVDKLFIGTDGFTENIGFSCIDLQRAEIAVEMSKRANKAIILTDSSKFKLRSVAKQLDVSEVSTVITDNGIDHASSEFLQKSGIELIIVNL